MFYFTEVHQERIYQEFCNSKANEKVQQLESYYKQMSARRDTEITSILWLAACDYGLFKQ